MRQLILTFFALILIPVMVGLMRSVRSNEQDEKERQTLLHWMKRMTLYVVVALLVTYGLLMLFYVIGSPKIL